MESNVHAPWFQGSKIINKTFFFCLSVSVINTTSYNRNSKVSVVTSCVNDTYRKTSEFHLKLLVDISEFLRMQQNVCMHTIVFMQISFFRCLE